MNRFRDLTREVMVVYSLVLAVIIVAALVASVVPVVASLLYAIVAFVFIGAAQRAFDRAGREPEDFGISRVRLNHGIGWGLLATLITLPLFAVGFWVWEVQIKERTMDISLDHYFHWAVDHEGEPDQWGTDQTGVWVWTRNDTLMVGVRNHSKPNNQVLIRAEQPFKPTKRGALVLKPVGNPDENGLAQVWEVALTHANSRGVVVVRGPRSITLSTEPAIDGNPRWPMFLGPNRVAVEEAKIDLDRNLWWIVLWVATQFLLIAFPEEYFYRGYVQTRLKEAFDARESSGAKPLPAPLGFTPEIVLTSLLFGLGHLLVPIGGVLVATRMSVFFPSLIFGWLRAKTDNIVASVFYHACCNLMVLFAAVHF